MKVPTFLVPATQKVWMDLYSLPVPGADGKTCAEIFEQAGCDTPTSPSCAACLGGPRDTYARMNDPQVFSKLLVLVRCSYPNLTVINVSTYACWFYKTRFCLEQLIDLNNIHWYVDAGLCFNYQSQLSRANGTQRGANISCFTIYCCCLCAHRICHWSSRVFVRGWHM